MSSLEKARALLKAGGKALSLTVVPLAASVVVGNSAVIFNPTQTDTLVSGGVAFHGGTVVNPTVTPLPASNGIAGFSLTDLVTVDITPSTHWTVGPQVQGLPGASSGVFMASSFPLQLNYSFSFEPNAPINATFLVEMNFPTTAGASDAQQMVMGSVHSGLNSGTLYFPAAQGSINFVGSSLYPVCCWSAELLLFWNDPGSATMATLSVPKFEFTAAPEPWSTCLMFGGLITLAAWRRIRN